MLLLGVMLFVLFAGLYGGFVGGMIYANYLQARRQRLYMPLYRAPTVTIIEAKSNVIPFRRKLK